MGIVTKVVGCGLSCVGLDAMYTSALEPNRFLGRAVNRIPNDTSVKQISRFVGRILAIVGIFILGWTGLAVGVSLVNTASGVSYAVAFNKALALHLPDAIIGLGSYVVGEITRRLGGEIP